MELFKLLGTIAIDNQEANDGINETVENAEKSEDKLSSTFKKIGGAVAGYMTVDAIKDFGAKCIEAAAGAAASSSQFSQVFGDLEGAASSSLSQIADSTGIAENRLKGSYSQIASFAKTTGMDTADALSLADRAMVAVADSAAFYDRSLEDTTESLQSFLKGNYENDAALGLSCTEVTRNAAANELYGKSFNELSESQKQLTLLKMVEDANQLSGAMGQAANESDTWSNQTGNLQQSWTDFTAEIGSKFLPIAVKVVGWIAEKMPEITEIVSKAMDKAGEVIKNIGPVVKELFDKVKHLWDTVLKPCFEAVGGFIKDVLAPTFKTVFNDSIGPAVKQAFELIKDLWNNTLKPIFEGITDFLSGVFTGNWEQAFEGLVNILKGAGNGIITGIEVMVNGAINAVNNLIEGINSLGVVEAIAKAFGVDGIPLLKKISLPRLEKGGILEKGQVGLLEGTGAEAVVPLHQNRAWISAVANDMDSAIGGKETAGLLGQILAAINDSKDELKESFACMSVEFNGRELGRVVDRELGRFGYQKARGRGV